MNLATDTGQMKKEITGWKKKKNLNGKDTHVQNL